MPRRAIQAFYDIFSNNREKITFFITVGVLLFSLIVGAGYRIVDVKQSFGVNNGFEFFVNMASHFWTNPGSYNFEESLKMKAKPDDYIFTRHPKEPGVGSFENEKGWAFILSLILPEGQKGIRNLEMTVVQYQLMIDLLVLIMLFFVGRSLAGLFGGSLAAILYALFKPSISMVSWVSYYYWAIPFSALSLFFWTVVYQPEKEKRSLKALFVLFLLYGMAIGFATSVRLGFLLLPLALSPLIFLREKSIKRGLILLAAMLIGQSILLAPQILITHKYYDKFDLSVRGKWHGIINGLGAYPNPFGVKDTGDLTAVKWAIDRGGPDLNKTDIQAYDRFMKKEAISLFKERPDIFLTNFKNNLYAGITLTPETKVRYIGGPVFLGVMKDADQNSVYGPEALKIAHIFPWLLFLAALCYFLFWKKYLAMFMTLVLQGLYLLGMLCIYFPPADVHTTAYFPVFVALTAISVAIIIKGLFHVVLAIPKGDVRVKVTALPFFAFAAAFIILIVLQSDIPYRNSDAKTIASPTILDEGKYGGFESWTDEGDALPYGWYWAQTYKNDKEDIQKAAAPGEVTSGLSSARLHAKNGQRSAIAYIIPSDKLYFLLGKTITVYAWVKASFNDPKDVRISIMSINASRYNNVKDIYCRKSGEWELLTAKYRIPAYTQIAVVSCIVENNATAYFDDVRIQYEEK